jgi:glycosyltransferase involved in cell wall biosynthesis
MGSDYSVVIPSFNSEFFIKRTLESVLAQTYLPSEIIVVDDGSTDDTAKVVKSYGDNVRYIYQDNAGDGPARNTGIKAAKGDWIAFLDHDDEWLPKKLEIQMKLLSENPFLRWCATNFYKRSQQKRTTVVNPQISTRDLIQESYFESFFEAACEKRCVYMTSTMVVHRQVFEEVGLFESFWLRCADLDMWWRIAHIYPKIGYIPQPLVTLHIVAQDKTSTRLRLEAKHGTDARKLISKHLRLAEEHGCRRAFESYAKKFILKRFWTTVYHGFKPDALALLKAFPDFFPGPKKYLIRLILVFSGFTSFCLRSAASFMHLLRLDKSVSRRWIVTHRSSQKDDSQR